MLATLFWKRVRALGAAAAMVVGAAANIAWEVWGDGVNSVAVSFPSVLLTFVVVSLLSTPAPVLQPDRESAPHPPGRLTGARTGAFPGGGAPERAISCCALHSGRGTATQN